jgi:hypothetical protein
MFFPQHVVNLFSNLPLTENEMISTFFSNKLKKLLFFVMKRGGDKVASEPGIIKREEEKQELAPFLKRAPAIGGYSLAKCMAAIYFLTARSRIL